MSAEELATELWQDVLDGESSDLFEEAAAMAREHHVDKDDILSAFCRISANAFGFGSLIDPRTVH